MNCDVFGQLPVGFTKDATFCYEVMNGTKQYKRQKYPDTKVPFENREKRRIKLLTKAENVSWTHFGLKLVNKNGYVLF